ncbi:MAG: 4Fe-4S binding protein [Halanaerobiaceae bacterium]|nr:4Fe-4S binding protein [Halanaerobiaceae bacterium]
MKKLTVISGKGGTGKTTIVSNLAVLAGSPVLADCDVDAPNMHLLLKPVVKKESVFKSVELVLRDEDKCMECGICRDVCRFAAISPELEINPIKCDGCAVCKLLCPVGAIRMEVQETGRIYVSETRFGPMVHARLKAGVENSGKLVSEVRVLSDELAAEQGKELILIDGSPGIGCPVIASLKGVKYALIVTEPTLSGLSDLKRILELTSLFGINTFVVINKYDLNEEISSDIEEYCAGQDIELAGRVSFSPLINQTLREGQLLLETVPDSEPARQIREVWNKLEEMME